MADFPDQTPLHPTGPPSAVLPFRGAIPPEAFAARVQVTGNAASLDPARDPFFGFLLQTECRDERTRRVSISLGETATQEVWDAARDAVMEEEEAMQEDKSLFWRSRDERRWGGCEVVLRAVMADGTSASVHVFDFMPHVMVSLGVPRKDAIARFRVIFDKVAAEVRAPRGKIHVSFQKRPAAYGYTPDPSDPTKRRDFLWACVRCPTQDSLRAVSRAFEENGYAVEEGVRIDPGFKFRSERSLVPASWFVVEPGSYTVVRAGDGEPRSTFRAVNVYCSVRAIHGLNSSEDLDRWRGRCDPSSRLVPKNMDSVPPCLFAYADIEAKSHSEEAFADPTKPGAPCYIIGVTFAWTFGVPPSLLRATEAEPDAETKTDDAKEMEEIAEARVRRAFRRAERVRRLVRWESNPDVLRALEGRIEDLNSDDESEGTEAEESAIRKRYAKLREEEAALHRAQRASWAWPSGSSLWEDMAVDPSHPSRHQGRPGVVMDYPCLRVLLVLGACDPIPGAVVITFENEIDLLRSYRVIVAGLMDVDGVRGFNWLGFDSRYILERGRFHGCPMDVLRLGMMPSVVVDHDKVARELMIQGTKFTMTRFHQTNTVDVYFFFRRNLNLSSYKLESVAQNFGLNGKHPVTVKHINAAFDGTPSQRAVVAAYCAQDCDLLVHLARVTVYEITWLQFSRVSLTDSEMLWTTGQQRPIMHKMFWEAQRRGFVLDGLWSNKRDPAVVVDKCEGGFVMDPIPGFHENLTTLDYMSLYPSIIRAYNLCITTALMTGHDDEAMIARIRAGGAEVLVFEFDAGRFAYVQTDHNLMPTIQKEWWDERRAVKREMKTAKGVLYHVLDKRQLALKGMMNSAYGVNAAQHGAILAMLRIAHTITFIGRSKIIETRGFIEGLRDVRVSLYGREDVPLVEDEAPRAVYGDTDSVMITPPTRPPKAYLSALRAARHDPSLGVLEDDGGNVPPTRAEMLLYAEDVALFATETLNRTYRAPMELEFEETALTVLFVDKKKCYAKCTIERSTPAILRALTEGRPVGKLKASGLTAVRRDRCDYARSMQRRVVTALVVEGNTPRALQLIRRRVTRLALGEVDWDALTLTTALRSDKPNAETGGPPGPHVAIAWAMERQKPGSQPSLGERVPWVVVRTSDRSRLIPPDRLLGSRARPPPPPPPKDVITSTIKVVEHARHRVEVEGLGVRQAAHLAYYLDKQLGHTIDILFEFAPEAWRRAMQRTKDLARPILEASMTGRRTLRLTDMFRGGAGAGVTASLAPKANIDRPPPAKRARKQGSLVDLFKR